MSESESKSTLAKSPAYEQLEQQKLAIENQLSELEKVLIQEDNVGMSGPLVDSEGYPRADIDLYKVRLARQQINCLKNDYKQVMNLIEIELGKIYSSNKPSESVNGGGAAVVRGRAFCEITQVDAESPASEAGFRVGDQIVQFGPFVHESVGRNLAEIAELVKSHENKIILVNVARNGGSDEKTYVKIKLVPKRWSGHGLLGCKIVPIG